METPNDKSALLRAIRASHAEMHQYLASLTPEQLGAPVLDDGWSVKDSLAHISAWENMTIGWLEASRRGEYVRRYTPEFVQGEDADEGNVVLNALNNHLFRQNHHRAWDDVLAEFNAAHENLYRVVERMTEDEIFNPTRFAWRKGSPAFDMIAGNTYDHYAEHMDWIKKAFPV
ncbi:MAG: ClbS/DfsB family four-helix bundle protein [Chloroflexi bacterium]|nr:ClbS/DfsB family four-helix bundle protein [Chloroflexota bacterium]